MVPLLVQDFFFPVNPSARIFFQTNIAFFWTAKSWFIIYVFVLYKLFYTHNRSKDTGHINAKSFENVHTVKEEEATWSGRLPCAFFQSLPSGIRQKKKGKEQVHVPTCSEKEPSKNEEERSVIDQWSTQEEIED